MTRLMYFLCDGTNDDERSVSIDLNRPAISVVPMVAQGRAVHDVLLVLIELAPTLFDSMAEC